MRYKNFFKIKNIKRIFISHPKYIILFITTCISLVYFSWGINSWKFSFVGDEWSSYTFAKEYSEKNFLINPFSFNGVFHEHSVLASLYQAILLKILGYSNFAWKLSNILLIIPITIFFYMWIKKTFGVRVALVSTVILQSSFYLSNYFKNGTIQPECLTLFIISLYLASTCITNPTRKNLMLLGLTLGVSFYIYLGPLFVLILSPYFLYILQRSYKKRKLKFTLISLFLPYLLLLLPLLFTLNEVGGPLHKTVAAREYHNNFQILINIFHNFLLFYKNYDYLYNHFVAGPYLDLATRILAFIGTIIVILNARKKEYLFLLLIYVLTCVIIGATSPYSYAPTNRGLFFLPFGFVFAGIALGRIMKIFSLRIAFLIIPLIFIINVYQSQIGVFKEAGYTGTGLIIKSLQDAKENNPERKIVLLLSDYNTYYNYQQIYTMQQAYGLKSIKFEVIKSSQFQCNLLKEADVLIFDNDLEAKNAISYLVCPLHYNLSIKTLIPSIYL